MSAAEEGIQLVLHATATASDTSTTADTLVLFRDCIYPINPTLRRPFTVHDIMSFSTSIGSGSVTRSAPTEPRLRSTDVLCLQTSVCRESIVRESAARMNTKKNIDVKSYVTTARQRNFNRNPFSHYTPSNLRRFICCGFNGVVVPTPDGPNPTVTLYRSPWSNQYQTIYNYEDITVQDLLEDSELGQQCLQEAHELFSLKGLILHKQNLESTSRTGNVERQVKSRELEVDLNRIFNDFTDAYYRAAVEIEPEETMRDVDEDGNPLALNPLDYHMSKEHIHNKQEEARRLAAMPDRLRKELQEYQANAAGGSRMRQAPIVGERDHNCLSSVFVRDFAIERERKDDSVVGDNDNSEHHKQHILEVMVIIHNESKDFGGIEKKRRWTTVHLAHIWQVDVLLKLTMFSKLCIAIDGEYGDHIITSDLRGEEEYDEYYAGEDGNVSVDEEINGLLSSLGPVPSVVKRCDAEVDQCSTDERDDKYFSSTAGSTGSAFKKNGFMSNVFHDSFILSSSQDALIANPGAIREMIGNAVQSVENEEFLSAIDGVIGPSVVSFLKRRLINTDVVKHMATEGTHLTADEQIANLHSCASHNNRTIIRDSIANELKQFLSTRRNILHI